MITPRVWLSVPPRASTRPELGASPRPSRLASATRRSRPLSSSTATTTACPKARAAAEPAPPLRPSAGDRGGAAARGPRRPRVASALLEDPRRPRTHATACAAPARRATRPCGGRWRAPGWRCGGAARVGARAADHVPAGAAAPRGEERRALRPAGRGAHPPTGATDADGGGDAARLPARRRRRRRQGSAQAAILLDAWLQGHQRALWVSASADLLVDARRDLEAVCTAAGVPPLHTT